MSDDSPTNGSLEGVLLFAAVGPWNFVRARRTRGQGTAEQDQEIHLGPLETQNANIQVPEVLAGSHRPPAHVPWIGARG